MRTPNTINRLRVQASFVFQLLIACEFNMRAREENLTREERARLNRIADARRRANARLQRRLRLRAA